MRINIESKDSHGYITHHTITMSLFDRKPLAIVQEKLDNILHTVRAAIKGVRQKNVYVVGMTDEGKALKIASIKELREIAMDNDFEGGRGLKEAKDIVESFIDLQGGRPQLLGPAIKLPKSQYFHLAFGK